MENELEAQLEASMADQSHDGAQASTDRIIGEVEIMRCTYSSPNLPGAAFLAAILIFGGSGDGW